MISLEGIKKRYDDFSLDVDLKIGKGCITGLVGKNGAGKSTVIKLILGLVKPDDGSISLLGNDIDKLTAKDKEKLGVALAEAGFSPQLRGADIIKILRKSYSDFDEEMFRNECKRMKLPLDKPIKEFSTGMKAKMKVLVAITHNAKILIMDEPTSGLDVEVRGDVLDMIRRYMEEDEDRTVLITSHISSDLESICDDIYLIDNGSIILHEDTDVILGEYAVLKMNEETYNSLDKEHIITSVKAPYGYSCITKEKLYYAENYPGIVIEKGSIDELILMLTGGNDK